MSSRDPINIAVVAGSVVGSLGVVGTIFVVILCISYCKYKWCPEPQEQVSRHLHHHHRRRRRQRENYDEENGETAYVEQPLENSELQVQRPPSYSRANQYSSIETDIHVVSNEGGGTHRVSMYIPDDEESINDPQRSTRTDSQQEQQLVVESETSRQEPLDTLPPTYSTAQMATIVERSAHVEPQSGTEPAIEELSAQEEGSAVEHVTAGQSDGALPPSYSTAKLELMRQKADMEHEALSS